MIVDQNDEVRGSSVGNVSFCSVSSLCLLRYYMKYRTLER